MSLRCSYCGTTEGHINQVAEGVSLIVVGLCEKETCFQRWIKACRKAYHLARGETSCDECNAFDEERS
jgi:hypothetical protein